MDSKEQFLQRAQQLTQSEQYIQSVQILRKGLQQYAKDADLTAQINQTRLALFNKAKQLLAENKFVTAQKLLEDWLKLFPKDDRMRSLLEQIPVTQQPENTPSKPLTTKPVTESPAKPKPIESESFSKNIINSEGMEWFNERLRLGFRLEDTSAIVTRTDNPKIYKADDVCIEIDDMSSNHFKGRYLVGYERQKQTKKKNDKKKSEAQDSAITDDLTEEMAPKIWTAITGKTDASGKLNLHFNSHKRFFWQKPSAYDLMFDEGNIDEREKRDVIIQRLHMAKLSSPIVMTVGLIFLPKTLVIYIFLILVGILGGSPWIYQLIEPLYRQKTYQKKEYKKIAIHSLLALGILMVSILINIILSGIIIYAIIFSILAFALWIAISLTIRIEGNSNIAVMLSLALGREHIPGISSPRRYSRSRSDSYYDNLDKERMRDLAQEERQQRDEEEREQRRYMEERDRWVSKSWNDD
jgi:hypothetical protein